MSDGKQNSDRSERDEPQRRNPRDDFKEQLKRIRDEAVGDLKKSLGMPKEDTRPSRRSEVSSSRGGPSRRQDEEMPARASETAGPSAPGKSRIQVTGEPLAQHRERRQAAGYTPASEVEQLLDAKDAGQYYTAATAGGMSESANGATGLEGIRSIYHKLGKEARDAGDLKEAIGRHYPQADPSKVEKDMVNQTTVGMKILKEAFQDGVAGRDLRPIPAKAPVQQSRNTGTTARPSGIVGSLLNKLRGSSEFDVTSNVVAGVRGSQTETPDTAYARNLLHRGHLRDGDIDAVLSLLDSNDQSSIERLRTILAKYRAERIVLD